MGRFIGVGFIFGVLGFARPAQAAFHAVLQGVSKHSTNYICCNLQDWNELDYIPARVKLSGGPIQQQVIRIDFDHAKGTIPGIENLSRWTLTDNVRITSEMVLHAPPDEIKWSYTFTIDVLDDKVGYIDFMARLAAGAHLNTGSSLAMGGTPSLGTLQVHKPGAAPGAPDLVVVKSGAAQAEPGEVITYTLDYQNKPAAATGAVGVQISDFLPVGVTYVTNSAVPSAVLVGNRLIWDLADLLPGDAGTYTYQVRVADSAAYNTSFSNFAQILSSEDDATPEDNHSSVTTTVLYNRPPVAVDDVYAVAEDGSLEVGAPGLLGNDSDPDGDNLSLNLVDSPQHGSLVLNPNGSFTYTPEADYVGSDAFTYRANDGELESGVATVLIDVLNDNDAPVAYEDVYTTPEDVVLVINAPGLLGNDADMDGDALSAVLVTPPSHGTLVLNADGSFSYTPNPDFYGLDGFTYQANDGVLSSSAQSVLITVLPVNDAPTVSDGSYTTPEDTTLVVDAPGVLTGSDDVEGDGVTVVIVDQPDHGTVVLNPDGSFTYTPDPDFEGEDTFTFVGNDGTDDSNPATVVITVGGVNDAPTAGDSSYTTEEDTALVVSGPGVLTGATDPEGDDLTAVLVQGPDHGTLVLNPDGSFTYTPEANFEGEDSFTFVANDGEDNSAPATVTITVTGVNDAPTVSDGSYTTPEDTTLVVDAPGVLTGSDDVEGDGVTVVIVDQPDHGTVVLNPDGSFTYTPDPDFEGEDTFTFVGNDGTDDSNPATVVITVGGVNDAPTAGDSSYTTEEDTALVVSGPGVLTGATDPEGDDLTAVLVQGPDHGTLVLNPDGSFTYTPEANFEGEDSFTFVANDGEDNSAPATVTITVTGVNDAPTVSDGSYTTPEDTTLVVDAPGVLTGSDDVEGDGVTVVIVDQPDHGTVVLNPDGSFTYTPDPDFEGEDTFTFVGNDGTDDSNPATVVIHVTPVNDQAVAVEDAYATPEDTTLIVAAPGVLANDSDPDGDTLTAVLVDGPAHGDLSLSPNGSFSYTPDVDFAGEDAFTYSAHDGAADSGVVSVVITVTPVNDDPVAVDDLFLSEEDQAISIPAAGVLANDNDVDGDSLTAVLVDGPTNGTLTLNTDGSFTYTPGLNFVGEDSFTYKANDGEVDSNVATVTVVVESVNDTTEAVDDAYVTKEDVALVISAPGVLLNDIDVDGDALSAVLVSQPAHGAVVLNADGSFTYTPAADFVGDDSFTYKAHDGIVESGVATVRITVTPVNDIPTALDDAYNTDEETELVVAAPGVLENDFDVDGDDLVAVLVSAPVHGVLNLNSDGSFTYLPDPDFTGQDLFTYLADDGELSGLATVRINVGGVNDAPVAVNDAYVTEEDTELVVTAPGVLVNDTDVEGNSLTAILVSGPAHGGLSLNADGSFSYTPEANYTGTDSFTYKANDGEMDSGVATVTITITGVNDGPLVVDDAYTTEEDTELVITAPGVLVNDTDVEGNGLTAILVSGPAHGGLSLNAEGSFSYTPEANYTGTDSFTYKANDGEMDSGVATVTITITGVNDGPMAVDDVYTTEEDTELVITAPGVLANDTDIEGNGLTAIIVSGPAHGGLSLNADGSFSYTPEADYTGNDSFTYKANDGEMDSGVATVTITVTGVNDGPLAVDDAYTTEEDTELLIAAPGVLVNDTDVEGNGLTAILVGGPAHGSLSLNADGSLSYTPEADYTGTDSFTYKANDGEMDSGVATVTITVTGVNDGPVAVDDAYTTEEDTELVIVAPGVLVNDTDVEGNGLTAIIVSGPAHGGLSLNADGSFSYTPEADYTGTDSFTYKANDGEMDSGVATVTITVTGVNDGPVAVDDAYTTEEDTELVVTAPGVLVNDTDVEGNGLTAIIVSGPAHGSLSLNADGSFSYTPEADYTGTDSFTYKANDGEMDSGVATVTITVTGVNDGPVAVDDAYTTEEDTELVITAPGVLVNDTDVEGNGLTAILVSGPAHGSLSLNADGSFIYTPEADYTGTDSFTYKANDGEMDSGVATVTITITGVNDGPVAVDDAYTTEEDTELVIVAPGVLVNDSDMEGNGLTAILVSGPAHGSLSLNADGSFIYTPEADYTGTDSFTYKANDGEMDSGVATVTITITGVNDGPVAVDDAYTTEEDTELVIAAPGVLVNDSDMEGNGLTAILVSGPAHGGLSLNADGSFSYTPEADYTGTDRFTYKANDGEMDSGVATVTITITGVNDGPVAVDDAYTTEEDTELVIAAPGVLVNDSDMEGNGLTAILVSGPAHGGLSLNADGSLSYTPEADYTGTDSFTYKANDGEMDSGVATVTITITGVNDGPVAVDDAYTTEEDTELVIAAPGVLVNDSDMEGSGLTANLVSGPAHGSLSLNADGSFSYTPGPDYFGDDQFTYTAHDGSMDSDVMLVRISVLPVNDAPSFAGGSDILVAQDSGAFVLGGWARAMTPGPANEAGQGLTFMVEVDRPELFARGLVLDASGRLDFAVAEGVHGVATVTVILKDDGGTERGGVDVSDATIFTITINAPPVVAIARPLDGAVFAEPAEINVLIDAMDPDGEVTRVDLYEGTNLVATLDTFPYSVTFTNVAEGTYAFTAVATDDRGATGTSAPVTVQVVDSLGLLAGPVTFNPQSGLFEQRVTVTNDTQMAVSAVRVLVDNLSETTTVYNASGTEGGTPFVQYNSMLEPGMSVTFVIEYHDPLRITPNPVLIAQVAPPAVPPNPEGEPIRIHRQLMLADGSFMIEFNTTLGGTYYVQYSSDLRSWKTAFPSVTGTGYNLQWIDNGPPKTESFPSREKNRYYRVLLVP